MERTYNWIGKYYLPPWHSISILNCENRTKKVIFNSKIHINTQVEVPFCFSEDFNDYDILHDKDLLTYFINKYGVGSLI